MSVSPPQRTSTQEVFPPTRLVSLPGAATLPRTPQKCTSMEGFFRGGMDPQQCRKKRSPARNLSGALVQLDQMPGQLPLGAQIADVVRIAARLRRDAPPHRD